MIERKNYGKKINKKGAELWQTPYQLIVWT